MRVWLTSARKRLRNVSNGAIVDALTHIGLPNPGFEHIFNAEWEVFCVLFAPLYKRFRTGVVYMYITPARNLLYKGGKQKTQHLPLCTEDVLKHCLLDNLASNVCSAYDRTSGHVADSSDGRSTSHDYGYCCFGDGVHRNCVPTSRPLQLVSRGESFRTEDTSISYLQFGPCLNHVCSLIKIS